MRVDGAPVYRHIPGTDLARLVNTKALIVRDTAGIHYLKALDGWMESYDLVGGWSPSGVSPFGENRALERAVLATIVDRLASGTSSLDDDPPTVFVSTEPAALIVTNGPPRFEIVPGTFLEVLANGDAPVFREPTDQELYVRVEGDWYRAWTTDGPWQFIPTMQLPSDIARQIAKR